MKGGKKRTGIFYVKQQNYEDMYVRCPSPWTKADHIL